MQQQPLQSKNAQTLSSKKSPAKVFKNDRIPFKILTKCKNISHPTDKLRTFLLPLDTTLQKTYVTRKYFKFPGIQFNQSPYDLYTDHSEKVLLVVGATGSGKTTLINGMINYILGVQWKDDFRFKLITNETTDNQAHSQTQMITAYTIGQIDGSPLPYTITIIDTPGFGDTRGLHQDKLIVKQITELFSLKDQHGINHLHGIGFVLQSSAARLTPIQKYIFQSILSLFGNDVVNNFFTLITFADGSIPPVIDAINAAKIPYQKAFKFNNSAIFETTEGANDFSEMFWKMGFTSFRKFFVEFSRAKAVSLTLTKEVLKEREHLEVTIQGLRPQIDEGMATMERIRQEKNILKTHAAEIAANKEFRRSVTVPKIVKINVEQGRYVTNCVICNFTCHNNCIYANDDDKINCSAMMNGKCTVCKGKCDWFHHHNNPFYFEVTTATEVTTLSDLKEKYYKAVQGKSQQEAMMVTLESELAKVKSQVRNMVISLRTSINRLDQIALRRNPLTEIDHLNLLIESEKQQKNPGFEGRIKFYEDEKKGAEIFNKIKAEQNLLPGI